MHSFDYKFLFLEKKTRIDASGITTKIIPFFNADEKDGQMSRVCPLSSSLIFPSFPTKKIPFIAKKNEVLGNPN